MKDIPWDDDDVNAQSKFALQRAAKYDELARWAGQLAERSQGRTDFLRLTDMQAAYSKERDAAVAVAHLMWSN